jgi:5-methylcytosine-specific restriction endonuclease McrA
MDEAVVREVFGDTCAACGQPADTVDHILALSKGGFTEVPNLQPMCRACNAAKGASDVDIIEVKLTFPLRPAPSDSYEGMLW